MRIYARGSGKTILNVAYFLEDCKNESKTEEDKLFFEAMKQAWLELNYGTNNSEE
jgi:hypothetical protein